MKKYNNILVYDLETNGFFSKEGKTQPIELAYLSITPNTLIAYNELYKPSWKIPSYITDVNGITNEMVENKGEWFNEIDKLYKVFIVDDTLIIGHNNIKFDNKFINQLFVNKEYPEINDNNCFDTGGEFKAELLGTKKETYDTECSIAEFHKAVLDIKAKDVKWNLTAALEHYEIPKPEGMHRALTDVLCTTKVFIKQIDKYLDNTITINPDTLNLLKQLIC